MKPGSRRGFTLIELLCVCAIILILVSLMIGPVFRAGAKVKRMQWEENGHALAERFRDKMEQHLGRAADYPARGVDELLAAGMIDGQLGDFLKDKRVKFFPFSSKTPDPAPILMVEFFGYVQTLRKADIQPRDD